MQMTRRTFLASTVAVASAMTLNAGAAEPARLPVVVFSKHLHFIKDYAELAKTAKSLGVDGLDLTVRKGGHVEPAEVAAKLPKCVEAVRSEGLDVLIITTYLKSGGDADAKAILDAASKLGIKYVRVGGHEYSKDGDIAKELKTYTEDIRGLADLLKAHNMVGAYHNHSGGTNVGAPLWDLYEMIRGVNNDAFGSNFDVGHASVEGGLGAGRLNARLLAPYVKATAVKDFVWEGGKVKWVPLGQGVVNVPSYFEVFRAAGFAGPVSMHFEYDTKSNDALLSDIKAAAVTVRADLQKAGYA